MQRNTNRTRCPEGRCHCRKGLPDTGLATAAKATKTLPSTLLSIFIAFFPKCPVCWAAYMSMFGCVGLAKLPYMKWLFPFLLILLGIHLYVLYRGAIRKGYLPFLISILGSMVVVLSRVFAVGEKLPLLVGMAAIIGGSVLNGFMINRPRYKTGAHLKFYKTI